jgi:hypothetical protein
MSKNAVDSGEEQNCEIVGIRILQKIGSSVSMTIVVKDRATNFGSIQVLESAAVVRGDPYFQEPVSDCCLPRTQLRKRSDYAFNPPICVTHKPFIPTCSAHIRSTRMGKEPGIQAGATTQYSCPLIENSILRRE